MLCSRDAKFAVDCDTCRLSYCLVCLASGSKDPCVRCGHRPSKRMEQLVHLRLKSIYKAFKQSSRNSKYGGASGDGTGGEEDDDDDDDDDLDDDDDDDTDGGKSGDPQSLLQAAASAASKHSGGGRSNSSRHHHHHHHASSHHATSAKRPPTNTAGSTISRDQQAKEMVDKYMAEKEKADAAAAALLAELEEEEEAIKSKKNKKKRKKDRKQAKKDEEHPTSDPPTEQQKATSPSRQKSLQFQQEDRMYQQLSEQQDEKEDDSDIEIIDIAKPSFANKKDGGLNGKKKKKNRAQSNKITDAEADNKIMDVNDGLSNKSDAGSDAVAVMDLERHEEPAVDPIEQELCQCVAEADVEGIEQILLTLKGVPGRAPLRKNAKKALKKLKAEQEAIIEEAAAAEEAKRLEEEEGKKKAAAERAFKEKQQTRSTSGGGTAATQSETISSTGASNRHHPPPPLPPNELYRLVSVTHGKPVNTTSAAAQRGTKGQQGSATPMTRSESVLHIAYNVVGWVIGKGGQRIRDLMEESGARVWIDQEHLSEKDPRIVYVSGGRKQVEAAVKLLKELVGKAPVPGGGAGEMVATPGPGAAPAPVLQLSEKVNIILNRSESRSAARRPDSEVNALAEAAGNAGRVVDPLPLNSSIEITPKPMTVENVPSHVPLKVDGKVQEHEMTCEACFVPLLIGRRGWTIKHIQDSSGARVDIDQTVTPRKVRISGNAENVQTAIRMVRDVLSYPHAQLQGAAESLEDLEHPSRNLNGDVEGHATLGAMDHPIAAAVHRPFESTTATMSNTTTVGASNQMPAPPVQSSPVLMTRTAEDRVHSPPPSSHINIGDAKSTISASSSLSSTPEPSMASTAKGHYGGVGAPGPLLPHDYVGNFQQQQQLQPAPPPKQQQQKHPGMTSANPFGQQNSLHQMNLNSLADAHVGPSGSALAAQQHVSPPLFPGRISGSGMPPVSPRHDMQAGIPRGFPHPHHRQQHHEMQQGIILGQAAIHEQQQHQAHVRSMNGVGSIPSQGLHYQPRPDSHGMYHQSAMQYPAGMPSHQQASIHLHQQSAFHPSDHKQMHPHAAPERSMGNNRMHPGAEMGVASAADHRGKPGGYGPPGMWSEQGASLVLGADGTGSRQVRRTDALRHDQHGSQPRHQGSELRMNAGAAPLGGLGLGLSAAGRASGDFPNAGGQAHNSSGRDDSLMVDSLFGPSDVSNEEKNLLTSFQGLSFGGDGLGSDMWSKDLSEPWEGEAKGSSALFAAIQPNLGSSSNDEQHPSKSRFLWGATGEPRGQSS